MSGTELTVSDVTDSLTGFDEIAIEKHMGMDIYTDRARKPVMLMRSLVFVMKRREGLSDVDAHKAALGMTVTEIHDFFPDDPDDEIDPEAPETPEGKDDSQPETAPAVSPTSVSAPE